MLMPRTTIPLSLYFWYSFSSSTVDALHGPHQVAQKSITTTLPEKSDRLTVFPAVSFRVNDGALAPGTGRGFSSLLQEGNTAMDAEIITANNIFMFLPVRLSLELRPPKPQDIAHHRQRTETHHNGESFSQTPQLMLSNKVPM